MSTATALNKRFGVGFHLPADAIDFAEHETARTGIEHDVTPHPLGDVTVIYDVVPRVRREVAA